MKKNVRSFDKIKWLGIIILIAVIVIGNAYFSAISLPIRVTVIIVLSIITIALALTTAKGQMAFQYIKESRLELRKVVWPTRQETVQTTLMIAGIVLLMSLVLWGIDSLFAYFVGAVLI